MRVQTFMLTTTPTISRISSALKLRGRIMPPPLIPHL